MPEIITKDEKLTVIDEQLNTGYAELEKNRLEMEAWAWRAEFVKRMADLAAKRHEFTRAELAQLREWREQVELGKF